ncbi:MAG TPA: ABC transporter substrate-binding protein [Trebonia sp.]|jgi:iron complex transport system substrate-binding protein
MRLAAVAAAAVSATMLAGCGSASSGSAGPSSSATPAAGTTTAASFPVTIKAANGLVTVKSKPARIVSLSPTSTEDLYAVGAGSQVVAVDGDSNYPPGVPKTSLNGMTPNIEAIARYNPSLVVAWQNTGGVVPGLAKLGVPVLLEPAVSTLDGAYAQIEQIGQATGHAAQAQRLVASMKEQIAADVRKAAGHHDLTYYWELGANPFFSVASSTFIGQIMRMFGLKDVADAADKASDAGYPEVSEEFIITSRPQLIFLADNQPSDGGQTPAVVARRPGWSVIPAVQDHEVIPLNDDVASRWGPRLPQLVAQIAQAIEQAP